MGLSDGTSFIRFGDVGCWFVGVEAVELSTPKMGEVSLGVTREERTVGGEGGLWFHRDSWVCVSVRVFFWMWKFSL